MKNTNRGRNWIGLGALLAGLGVGLGAFGAHGLESWLPENFPEDAPKRLANWETAVRYQMYHAIALIIVGFLANQIKSRATTVAAICFLGGIALFSGLLYGWVVTDIRPFVMLVLVGGLLLIVGWIAVAVAVFRGAVVEQ